MAEINSQSLQTRPGVFFHYQLFLPGVSRATHQHHKPPLWSSLDLLPASSNLSILHWPNHLSLASAGSTFLPSVQKLFSQTSPPAPASRWATDHEASTPSPTSQLTFVPFLTMKRTSVEHWNVVFPWGPWTHLSAARVSLTLCRLLIRSSLCVCVLHVCWIRKVY